MIRCLAFHANPTGKGGLAQFFRPLPKLEPLEPLKLTMSPSRADRGCDRMLGDQALERLIQASLHTRGAGH